MEPAANSALVGWLRLLGWAVETGRDGDAFFAVARRPDERGDDLVAVATTDSAAGLPHKIFSAAFNRLEASRTVVGPCAVAA